MANNPTKHQRRSIRLKGYDYSQKGAYFVTICTCNKKCLFGKVVESKIVLNKLGQMFVKCWNEIPIHFPNVELDVFVIMPNHLHGIIVLTDYCRGGVPPPHWKGEATSPLREPTLGRIVAYFSEVLPCQFDLQEGGGEGGREGFLKRVWRPAKRP